MEKLNLRNESLIINALNLLADNEYTYRYNKPEICTNENQYTELVKLFEFIQTHCNKHVRIANFTPAFKELFNIKVTYCTLKEVYNKGALVAHVFKVNVNNLDELNIFCTDVLNDLNGEV